MASSETETPELSFVDRLISSRNRTLSFLLPFILGFTNNPNSTDPDDQSSPEIPNNGDRRDRIIFINPVTHAAFVIESSSSGIDSLLRELLRKDGQPPASKASIEAMPNVETKEGDECVICLEEWGNVGELAKEMPCKHKFHGDCIEKWLNIHGSCPVCRYKMPVDDDQEGDRKFFSGSSVEEDRGGRREIWIRLSVNNSDSANGETNQTASNESPSPLASSDSDEEMLG